MNIQKTIYKTYQRMENKFLLSKEKVALIELKECLNDFLGE